MERHCKCVKTVKVTLAITKLHHSMLGLFQLAYCLGDYSGVNVIERNATWLTGSVEKTGCIDEYCFMCTVYAMQHLTTPEE